MCLPCQEGPWRHLRHCCVAVDVILSGECQVTEVEVGVSIVPWEACRALSCRRQRRMASSHPHSGKRPPPGRRADSLLPRGAVAECPLLTEGAADDLSHSLSLSLSLYLALFLSSSAQSREHEHEQPSHSPRVSTPWFVSCLESELRRRGPESLAVYLGSPTPNTRNWPLPRFCAATLSLSLSLSPLE